MSRTGRDEIKDGYVWNGYDYSLQVWVVNGIVRDCSHPEEMKKGDCCSAKRLAGQRITEIPGAEKRNERGEEEPMWGPLCRVVGQLNVSAFMYMGKVLIEEKRIFLYKHILTRCYLNLDSGGQAYRHDSGTYTPIDLDEALAHAFGSHEFHQDRYQRDIDVVELSILCRYAGRVPYFFVILDAGLPLCSLAVVCESGNTDQMEQWSNLAQVIGVQDSKEIPGVSDTPVEVLRFEEAYLVKPDLRSVIRNQRKTANGILVHRLQKKSLPVFLKPGEETLCISKGVDIDLAVEILSNRREPAIEFLIESKEARIIRDFRFEEDNEEEIDLVLLQNGAVVAEVN